LKKTLIVLLLFITPFAQARAVLICSMMNGQVVEHCCCAGHAAHRVSHDAPDAACCDVAIEVSDKAFAGVTANQPIVKRVGHDLPMIAAVPVPALIIPTFAVAARPPPPDDTATFASDRLYLRTARLRL
jgi:hypothetical protein